MARKRKQVPKQIEPWRHSANCSICGNPRRAEIERQFKEFRSQAAIAKEYGLGSRQAVARHARALGLFAGRITDVRNVLHALIEKGMEPRKIAIPAAAMVSACVALSKLDEKGRSIERIENVSKTTAFLEDARWTREQMRLYAETGELPPWFQAEMPGTQGRSGTR